MLVFRSHRKEDPLIAAMEQIECPVFVVERLNDGRFQFVHLNRYFHRTVGLDPDTVCTAPLAEVLPQRMADALQRNYSAALSRSGTASFDEVHSLGGRDTWWRTTLSRAPSRQNGRARLIGLSIEITDAKARELRLTADMTDLKSAYQEVQAIAGLTVHDMRAPLRNVVSLIEIVLDGFKDMGDGKRDMIAACMEVANASIDSIDMMLDRVQIQGLPEPRVEPVALSEMCAKLAGLVDPDARLAIVCPEVTLETDPIILHALLRHLLKTASTQAESRIELSLEEDPARRRVILRIFDDGPGYAAGVDPVTRAEAEQVMGETDPTALSSALRLLRCRGGALTYRAPRDSDRASFELTLVGRIRAEPPQSLSA